MADMTGKGQPKKVTWEAVVIRADGAREDLGVVSYYHRNPLKRWAWSIKQKVRNAWPHLL